ncbi:MAG TPA: alpha/beta hydrolase [Pyrinomonadaceae bacterium]|jgi:pimeloyl-ACP methyl ester carboxylesterase
MKIKRVSSYKTAADRKFPGDWLDKIQKQNNFEYQKLTVPTFFGETVVLAHNHDRKHLAPLVYFPGFRTSGIFLDLNDNLAPLKKDFRLYLVDVIGQPGMSTGNTPDAKSGEYAAWIGEVFDGLNLDETNIAGASFGGCLCLKAARHLPDRITKAILLNPSGLTNISFAPKTSFYNFMPLIFPSRKTVENFMEYVVFGAQANVSEACWNAVAEFELHAIRNFRLKADYPYKMSDAELAGITVPIYLILGENDRLIPPQKTLARAKDLLPTLKETHLLKGVGHGIECSHEAVRILKNILEAA